MYHDPSGHRLAALLRHRDADVVRLAERGLWELWMNGGSPRGVRRLARAVSAMDDGELERAEAELCELTAAEPSFAEAHHQRGIALSLLERPDEAAVHYRRCVSLNRYHFAAMTGLGSAYVAIGDLSAALREYRGAVRIHPRLEGAAELIGHCQTAVGRLQPLA